MTGCLTVPSHYLNQYQLINKGFLWHSPKTNFTRSAHGVKLNMCSEIAFLPPRLQGANDLIWKIQTQHGLFKNQSKWALTRYVKLWLANAPEMLGKFFPPPTSNETAGQRYRHASRYVRHASAVMHVGIANPRWWEKIPGIPSACATHNFTYLVRSPCAQARNMLVWWMIYWRLQWIPLGNVCVPKHTLHARHNWTAVYQLGSFASSAKTPMA